MYQNQNNHTTEHTISSERIGTVRRGGSPIRDADAPAEWRRFIAGIEARAGVSAESRGYLALALRHMTPDEQAQAERMLLAYREEAEAGGLDVPLDSWASLLLADTRDAQWFRCIRDGCADRMELARIGRWRDTQGRRRLRTKGGRQ